MFRSKWLDGWTFITTSAPGPQRIKLISRFYIFIRTWLFLDTDLPTLNSKEPTAQAPHPAHEFGNAEGKAPWNFAHPVQFFKVAPQPLKSSASLRGANRSMHTLNAPSSPNTIGASD
jgi:hypothetical protein